MLVKLLCQTRYHGPKKKGDVIDVKTEVAQEWFKRGIAAPVENVRVVVNENKPYKEMTARELYDECISLGIQVEPKQPKSVYLNLLLKEAEAAE